MDNLKPFKKGHDERRNVTGKNKVPDIRDLIMDVIGEQGIKDILQAMHRKALKGSEKATEIVMDRVYGKAKQAIDLNANVQGEVIIERHVKGNDEDQP